MTDAELAAQSVSSLASSLGVVAPVDPVLVVRLAQLLVDVLLSEDPWVTAEKAGIARAGMLKTDEDVVAAMARAAQP